MAEARQYCDIAKELVDMRGLRAAFLMIAVLAAVAILAGCEQRANIRGDQTVVLLIDDQTDFLAVRGREPIPQSQAQGLIDATNAVIGAAAKNNVPVAYVRDEFSQFELIAYLEHHGAAPQLWAGSELDPSINEWAGPYFTKTVDDAFGNSRLQGWLEMQQAGKLVIGGVYAGGSVLATARGAIARGFHVVVLSDAIAGHNDADRDSAIKALKDAGARIQTSQEFISSLGSDVTATELPRPKIEYSNPNGLPG
jgi:nicotinamidase-related amidase